MWYSQGPADGDMILSLVRGHRSWCISRAFFFMLLMVGKSGSFSFESGEDRIAVGCGGGKQFLNCRYFRFFLPILQFLCVSFFRLLTVVLQGYFVQLEFILALLQERNLVKVYGEDDRIASDPRLFFTAKMVTSDTGCPLWMYKVHQKYLAILLSHTYC